MYRRDIPHIPNIIPRNKFVDEIFQLGLNLGHGYDTLITAVIIGDNFVSFNGERSPYKYYKENNRDKLTEEQIKLINELVPQEYSRELAHVSFVISSNLIDDWGYPIEDAANELNNGYVYKMQWEICMINNFHFSNDNFLSNLFTLIDYNNINNISDMFWDLTKHICMDMSLLYASHSIIILAIIILIKHDRLRAKTDYHKRIFQNIMIRTSQEYEIPLNTILQAYISYKSNI